MPDSKLIVETKLRELKRRVYKFHKQIEKEIFNLAWEYDLDHSLESEIKGCHLEVEAILSSVEIPDNKEKEEQEKEDQYWKSILNTIPRG